MDIHFFNTQRLLKNGQKSDSFAAHFEKRIKSTTSHTDLCNCVAFKVVNHLNPIGVMKSFTKPNCTIFVEEHLTILKRICDRNVTLINKNTEIYGVCLHRTNFR